MKIVITIDTGNAAFGDTPIEILDEVGRILAGDVFLRGVESGLDGDPMRSGMVRARRALLDINGNTVGNVIVIE